MDHIGWLQTQPPFNVLGPTDLRLLRSGLEVAYLASGEFLAKAGQTPSNVWAVRSGAIRRHQPGPDVVLEEGELIGAQQVLQTAPIDFDHEVIEDLLAYAIDPAVFIQLAANNDAFKIELGRRAGVDTAALAVVAHTVAGPAHYIAPTANVGEAARLMEQHGVDAVLVSGEPAGILTTRDLRSRVLAVGMGAEAPVSEVATFGVRSLAAETPLAEALVFLLEHDIHHAPLVSDETYPDLMLTNDDILAHFGSDTFSLLRRLGSASGDRSNFAPQITQAVKSMVRADVGAGAIGRAVSSLVDGLMRSLCAEAETQLGPPPAPYAFCACGSQGRREQTLLTDQDNFLVHGGGPGDDAWFSQLATFVVDGIIAAGIPSCEGGYMATNWSGNLDWWQGEIANRAANPTPDALLDLNVLADLRVVAGEFDDDRLWAPLHQAITQPLLVRRMASSAMKFKPPSRFSRFFGRDDHFDVKRNGIIPIVGLGRVFGLELGLSATSTADRLDAAAKAGLLSTDAQLWLTMGLEFLTGIRLGGQLRSLDDTGDPSAIGVERGDLNAVQQSTLRDLLRIVADVQATTTSRLGLDSVS